MVANQRLAAGTRLASGRYSIGKLLGEGGFGHTYKGADHLLRRTVAIKELFPDGSARQGGLVVPPKSLGPQGFADAKASFVDEARTLEEFGHQGIVQVIDVFEENDTAYLVMECLEGETLEARIAKAGKLPVGEVLQLAGSVGAALEEVHRAKLLHRDVKPSNVFLTVGGRTVLIDFGSARRSGQGKTQQLTRLVTDGYSPPEQYQHRGKFGSASDVYALAATLYHALKGHPPASALDRLQSLSYSGQDPLKGLPKSIPEAVRNAISSGLALRADQRPQGVASFVDALRGKRRRTPSQRQRRQPARPSHKSAPQPAKSVRPPPVSPAGMPAAPGSLPPLSVSRRSTKASAVRVPAGSPPFAPSAAAGRRRRRFGLHPLHGALAGAAAGGCFVVLDWLASALLAALGFVVLGGVIGKLVAGAWGVLIGPLLAAGLLALLLYSVHELVRLYLENPSPLTVYLMIISWCALLGTVLCAIAHLSLQRATAVPRLLFAAALAAAGVWAIWPYVVSP